MKITTTLNDLVIDIFEVVIHQAGLCINLMTDKAGGCADEPVFILHDQVGHIQTVSFDIMNYGH